MAIGNAISSIGSTIDKSAIGNSIRSGDASSSDNATSAAATPQQRQRHISGNATSAATPQLHLSKIDANTSKESQVSLVNQPG